MTRPRPRSKSPTSLVGLVSGRAGAQADPATVAGLSGHDRRRRLRRSAGAGRTQGRRRAGGEGPQDRAHLQGDAACGVDRRAGLRRALRRHVRRGRRSSCRPAASSAPASRSSWRSCSASTLCGPDVTLFDVLRATEYVTPALEILDARVQMSDPETGHLRTIVDTIADNAADAGLVLGGRDVPPARRRLAMGGGPAAAQRHDRGVRGGRRGARTIPATASRGWRIALPRMEFRC